MYLAAKGLQAVGLIPPADKKRLFEERLQKLDNALLTETPPLTITQLKAKYKVASETINSRVALLLAKGLNPIGLRVHGGKRRR